MILTTAAFYHIGWITFSRRGRLAVKEMAPGAHDFVHFFKNMAYHLGFSAVRPLFRRSTTRRRPSTGR